MGMRFADAFDPFRALRHGMEGFKREPVPVVVAGFLMFLLDACQGQGSNFSPPQGGDEPWSGDDPFGGSDPFGGMDETMALLFLGLACFGLCFALVVFVVKAWIEPGAWRVGARLTEDGTTGMDVLFSGKDAWLPMLGYKLLSFVVNLGTFVVAAAPGGLLLALGAMSAMEGGGDPNIPLLIVGGTLIVLLAVPASMYVLLGLQLGNLAISLDAMGTMAALDHSWGLAKGNRLRLLWFNIVNFFVGLLGLLLCCVGAIPARGLILCATSNAYLVHTRDDYEDFALIKEIGAG